MPHRALASAIGLIVSLAAADPAVPPMLKPELLTCTWVGGAGDQAFAEVAFQSDGSLIAQSGDHKLAVAYAADGRKCLGIRGDLNQPADGGGRNFAVKLTRKSPFDGKDWQVGYNQVHGILQQPYLISPAGWKWWDWKHPECKQRELMADSRGIDVFFPAPGRVVAWVWCDGGNSTITRDPRKLDDKNTWVHRGGGSSSYFLMGDAKTGEPLAGIAFPHRPADACAGVGRMFITGVVEGGASLDCLGIAGDPGCGFTITDDQMKAVATGTFGKDGSAKAIAVRGNLLAVAGTMAASASLPAKNPAQPKPGAGKDAFLAIVKLW